jgi:hypothetical protein
MGEEIELAAKTSAEVVTALTEASGALGPPQEFWGAITSGIHYRFYPRVIKQAQAAAEKIRDSGLPPRAYSEIPDMLLKAILEASSLETDENLQACWANLLANTLIEGAAHVDRAFPEILKQLEPIEAATLESLAERGQRTWLRGSRPRRERDTGAERVPDLQLLPRELKLLGITWSGLDNLVRLEILRYTHEMPNTPQNIADHMATTTGGTFTDFGWAFVQACRAPQAPGLDTT